jgi:methylmalonyl-CoA carboxyltransferase large subunit
MGAEAAVEVLFRRELATGNDNGSKRRELVQQFSDTFATPYVAAGMRLVDDIIEPAATRAHVAEALGALSAKRDWRPQKKHGLIPL